MIAARTAELFDQ